MGLKSMMAKAKKASPKMSSGDDPNRLVWLDMSSKAYTNGQNQKVPGLQGTIKVLPIVAVDGTEVVYQYDVQCYNFEGEERNMWARFKDPANYKTQLTEDQKVLITQLRGLVDQFEESVSGFPNVDHKSYALMFAYVLEHVNVDGEVVSDKESRRLALLIFPSKNVAKAVTACCQDMEALGDELGEEMYNDIFSRAEERHAYLSITFQKSDSSFGYDCTMNTKPIDRFAASICTPEEIKAGTVKIPAEMIAKCTSQDAIFFASNYDDDNDFDESFALQVKEQMLDIIDKAEKAAQASENLPPVPSKNRKKKSDLAEEETAGGGEE